MRGKLSIAAVGVFVAWACGDDSAVGTGAVSGGPDASTDDGSSSADSSSVDASLPPKWESGPAPEPMCSAANADCICGWGAPELIAVNGGYAPGLPAVAAGGAGQAIVLWGVADSSHDANPTVHSRVLDPRTERWQGSVELTKD